MINYCWKWITANIESTGTKILQTTHEYPIYVIFVIKMAEFTKYQSTIMIGIRKYVSYYEIFKICFEANI